MAIGISFGSDQYEDDDIGPFSHLKCNSPTEEDFSNLLKQFFDKKELLERINQLSEDDRNWIKIHIK